MFEHALDVAASIYGEAAVLRAEELYGIGLLADVFWFNAVVFMNLIRKVSKGL